MIYMLEDIYTLFLTISIAQFWSGKLNYYGFWFIMYLILVKYEMTIILDSDWSNECIDLQCFFFAWEYDKLIIKCFDFQPVAPNTCLVHLHHLK